MRSSGAVGRFHVDLGPALGDGEVHGHRHLAFPPRLGDDGIAHDADEPPRVHGAADRVEGDDTHQARIRRSVPRLTLRPERTTTAGPSTAPAFPVRQAATVTAEEGSIR